GQLERLGQDVQGVDPAGGYAQKDLLVTDFQQDGALLLSQWDVGKNVEAATYPVAGQAHAAHDPGHDNNRGEDDDEREGDLAESAYTGRMRRAGSLWGGKHAGLGGDAHLSLRIRSAGLMTSVSRMPNFSLTTTTSPCATRVPFTKTSRGSPAARSSSTTEPWLSCSRLRIGMRVRPTSMERVTGTSRMTSRFTSCEPFWPSSWRLSNSAARASTLAFMGASQFLLTGRLSGLVMEPARRTFSSNLMAC